MVSARVHGLMDDGVGTSSGKTYTVQSGDSLSKIGEKFGVSWQKIYDANRDKLDDPDTNSSGTGINNSFRKKGSIKLNTKARR